MQAQLDNRNVKIAFFIAPLISCIAGLVGILIFVMLTSNFSGVTIWPGLKPFVTHGAQVFLFMLVIAYLITLFFGLPCFLLLKRLNILNLFTLLPSAYIISNICLLLPRIFGGNGFLHLPNQQFLTSVLLCPLHLITLLGAFCFWWIAIRPRQDMVITHKTQGDKAHG